MGFYVRKLFSEVTSETSTKKGPAIANEAENLKGSHYADLPNHVIFKPVAMESLGGVGVSSLRFIREVSRRIDENIKKYIISFMQSNFKYPAKFIPRVCFFPNFSIPIFRFEL